MGLQRSNKGRVDAYVSKNSGGKKKENKGKLPLTHPPWTKKANHNHRMRCLVSKSYKDACTPKGVSHLTTADALQLKRNACYMVGEFKTYNFETFKRI
jgi:hypothetical protein